MFFKDISFFVFKIEIFLENRKMLLRTMAKQVPDMFLKKRKLFTFDLLNLFFIVLPREWETTFDDMKGRVI